jgi:transcriptional regulator with XRE-family HTH domain
VDAPQCAGSIELLTKTWREKNSAIVTVLTASRREAGLTQRQLVDQLPKWLGWDQTTLAKTETGRRRLDLVEFIELAKAMKLDAKTLFERAVNWR